MFGGSSASPAPSWGAAANASKPITVSSSPGGVATQPLGTAAQKPIWGGGAAGQRASDEAEAERVAEEERKKAVAARVAAAEAEERCA